MRPHNKSNGHSYELKKRLSQERTKEEKRNGAYITAQMQDRITPIIKYCADRAPQCIGCGYAQWKTDENGKLIPICPFGIPPYKWATHMFKKINHKDIREPVLTRRKGEE